MRDAAVARQEMMGGGSQAGIPPSPAGPPSQGMGGYPPQTQYGYPQEAPPHGQMMHMSRYQAGQMGQPQGQMGQPQAQMGAGEFAQSGACDVGSFSDRLVWW